MKFPPYSGSSVNVIFLSANSGGGHHAAAKSISQLIAGMTEVNEHTVDLYADRSLTLYPKLAKMRSKIPWMWMALLACTDNRHSISALWQLFKPSFVKSLHKQLDMAPVDNPDIIIATHHASAQCLPHIVKRYANQPKTVVFVTDYDVHQNWIAKTADLYVVASDKAYQRLLKQGKPVIQLPLLPCASSLESQLGHVIPTSLNAPNPSAPTAQASSFKLITVMGLDGTSESKLHKLLDKLDQQTTPYTLCIDIICGKNQKLQQRLKARQFKQLKVNVFGFVNDMPERLAQADLALLRLSPQIMTESLVAKTPIIAFDWHYHERENINLLRNFGAGDGSRGCQRQIALINQYCQNPMLREGWQQGARDVSLKQSSHNMVELIFSHLNKQQAII